MGKRRNRPVKHHYIPQCYLRQFAAKKGKAFQISVFDREEERSFKNNVKDVACQNYFNRIHLDGMDPNALESAMSEFETGLAEALVRINEARTLESDDDKSYLLTLIGLTALRNPDMRKNIRGIADGLGRMHIAARLQSPATYDAGIAEAKAEGALPEDYDVTFEEMKAAFEDGDFKIELDNNALISLEFQLLDHTIPLLHKRGWHLLRAPEGSGGFITSDRPFYLMWEEPAMREGPLAPGLAMMGTDIYFPISPTLAVVGAFNVGNTVEDVTDETVAVCNTTMPDGADRQVYSPDHKFRYARTREEEPRTGNQLISDKRFLRKR
ncbi:DUF4238 domain-containing protein [Bradyrhizobium manausense]|uniref:DUF4238 domain-containing protein n=1 Tax=Bradyrhizobium manausense TaxID=989370 RepID=UPI000A6AC169|nr:DUF4238 domain-containing protein [Bradyrhizobium manausense]